MSSMTGPQLNLPQLLPQQLQHQRRWRHLAVAFLAILHQTSMRHSRQPTYKSVSPMALGESHACMRSLRNGARSSGWLCWNSPVCFYQTALFSGQLTSICAFWNNCVRHFKRSTPSPLQLTASELWCLSGGNRGDYQNCSVLYCVLCTVISTLGWAVLTVLWIWFCLTGAISLCVDLFVFVCICVFFLFHTA